MNPITVYGIPNCDSVKKAVFWFRQNKINFDFHDFKKKGISHKKILEWCQKTDWQAVLNKKGRNWRSLSVSDQEKINSQATAINAMKKNPILIRRPVIEIGDKVMIGFDEQVLMPMINT